MFYKNTFTVLMVCIIINNIVYVVSWPLHTTAINRLDNYVTPTEFYPIQPALIYPKKAKLNYHARNFTPKDDKVIYIKLLKRKSYRPKKYQQIIDENSLRELQMKDIVYVKALANGQFSTHRLRVYRLPQFYAISVYKNTEKNLITNKQKELIVNV